MLLCDGNDKYYKDHRESLLLMLHTMPLNTKNNKNIQLTLGEADFNAQGFTMWNPLLFRFRQKTSFRFILWHFSGLFMNSEPRREFILAMLHPISVYT